LAETDVLSLNSGLPIRADRDPRRRRVGTPRGWERRAHNGARIMGGKAPSGAAEPAVVEELKSAADDDGDDEAVL